MNDHSFNGSIQSLHFFLDGRLETAQKIQIDPEQSLHFWVI
jgi:hypothetical protein